MFGLMKKPSQKNSNKQEAKAWPRRSIPHSKTATNKPEVDCYYHDDQKSSRQDQRWFKGHQHYEDLEDKILEVVMSVVNSPKKRSIKRQSLDAGDDKPLPINQGSKGKNKSLVLENIADQSCLCQGKELLGDAENINGENKKEVSKTLSSTEPSTVDEEALMVSKSISSFQNNAKCFLTSSSYFVLECKLPCDELTNLEPVQPSRHVSSSQVLEESSQEEEPKEAQPVYDLEQPTSLVLQPAIDSFLGEHRNKLCKESSLFDADPSLFVLVTQQVENYFGLAKVKEFFVPGFVFDKMIQPFEKLEHEKFFKPKCLMFDESCGLDCSLRVSLENKSFDLIRAEEQFAIVRKFSKLKYFFENVLSVSNSFHELFKPVLKDHVFDGSFSKIISFSRKMFLVLRSSKEFWINFCSNIILVYDKALDGDPRKLKCVLEVFENSPCTFDLSILVCEKEQVKQANDFVLKTRVIQGLEKQVDYGPREHLRKDRFQRRSTSIIQGSPILSFFFPIAYLSISLIIFFVTNPFPFDVGELDLRTNPFQEGGYDMILISSSHESRNRIKAIMEPKEEPPDFDFKTTNGSLSIRPTTTWTIYSTHLKNTSKLNQSNQISGEEVIQLSIQAIPTLRVLDIRVFNAGFRPNLKGSSYEPNFSGNMIHQVSFDNWIHLKICSDGKDINFTNRWICLRLYYATELKIESHSPAQVRSRPETNWRFFLDLIAFQQA